MALYIILCIRLSTDRFTVHLAQTETDHCFIASILLLGKSNNPQNRMSMARHGVFLLAWTLILAIGMPSTLAFTGNLPRTVGVTTTTSPRSTLVFSTPPESEGGDEITSAFADPLSSNIPQVSESKQEGTSYPIDVPSPILLASSMVLAIIGVGKKPKTRIYCIIIQPFVYRAQPVFFSSPCLVPLHSLLGNLSFCGERISQIIRFSGSGFDIFSVEPRFPFAVNAALSAGGLSVCLFLFYASILKAQAETEEDDKRYMSGR
jgi:hypothetical protein